MGQGDSRDEQPGPPERPPPPLHLARYDDRHPPFDVKAAWKRELKLSQDKRRARYRCGTNFVTAKSIATWDGQVDDAFAASVKAEAAAAREAELVRRKAARTAERRQQKKKERREQGLEGDSDEEAAKDKRIEENVARRAAEQAEQRERRRARIVEGLDPESSDSEQDDDPDARAERQAVEREELRLYYKKQARQRRDREEQQRLTELASENNALGSFEFNADLNRRVALIQADITTLEVEAVVNAANTSLLGGGGIDGAIHRAAGPLLKSECETLCGAETGQTKITRGYCLPAEFVLHTVGPMGEDSEKLRSCYSTILQLVSDYKIRSVALCGISTGIYGYPLFNASHVALDSVRRWLESDKEQRRVELVVFCTFTDKEYGCYQKLMPMYFPPKGKTTTDVFAALTAARDAYDAASDAALDGEIADDEARTRARKQKIKDEMRRRKEDDGRGDVPDRVRPIVSALSPGPPADGTSAQAFAGD